jgi:undecaprenyl pyrophosphate synthase
VDAAVLSTLSALGGTAIGAISSLGSTYLSTQAQTRAARAAAERAKREDLYGRFMDELARLYADALDNKGVDNERLTGAYALNGRIALYATNPVNEAAEHAMRYVVDLALGPKRTPEEVRALMDLPEANVIRAFAECCREELRRIV